MAQLHTYVVLLLSGGSLILASHDMITGNIPSTSGSVNSSTTDVLTTPNASGSFTTSSTTGRMNDRTIKMSATTGTFTTSSTHGYFTVSSAFGRYTASSPYGGIFTLQSTSGTFSTSTTSGTLIISSISGSFSMSTYNGQFRYSSIRVRFTTSNTSGTFITSPIIRSFSKSSSGILNISPASGSFSTSTALDESTGSPQTRNSASMNISQTRSCTCSLLVQNYGKPEEGIRIDVGHGTYTSVRESISSSDCVNHHKCNAICKKYGDYACAMINVSTVTDKPANVMLVSSVTSCPGVSYIHTVDYICVTRSSISVENVVLIAMITMSTVMILVTLILMYLSGNCFVLGKSKQYSKI